MTNFYRNTLTLIEDDLLALAPTKRSTRLRNLRKDIASEVVFTSTLDVLSDILCEDDLQAWTMVNGEWISGIATHNSLFGKYFSAHRDHDDLIQIVEDFAICMYGLLRARNAMDRYVAIATYAKFRSAKLDTNLIAITTLDRKSVV